MGRVMIYANAQIKTGIPFPSNASARLRNKISINWRNQGSAILRQIITADLKLQLYCNDGLSKLKVQKADEINNSILQ